MTVFFLNVRKILLPFAAWLNRLGDKFYIGLGVALSLVVVADLALEWAAPLKQTAADVLTKTRFYKPKADPDIVIVDIDEASLSLMAPEYGRWPWPRSVMGELVQGLLAQAPAAVVFAQTFHEPDVFNAAGDRYFRDVIARTGNVFFPMVRLPKGAGTPGDLKLGELPGARRLNDVANPEVTLAASRPYFYFVLKPGRLGTNEFKGDADGTVRRYPLRQGFEGWELLSVPVQVARFLGRETPASETVWLNFRGKPFAYERVSFFEVYFDLMRQERVRPVDEFKNKIVLVGASAPTLFENSRTALSPAHPNVEILATAIDNVKRGDPLSTLPAWIEAAIAILGLAWLTFAFVQRQESGVVQAGLGLAALGVVSLLTFNFLNAFIDFLTPLAAALTFFSLARANRLVATYRRNGHPFFSTVLDEGQACTVFMVQAHVDFQTRRRRARLTAALKKEAARSPYAVVAPPIFKGLPLMRGFFRHAVIFYWLVPRGEEREAYRDLLAVLTRTAPLIERAARRYTLQQSSLVTYFLHRFDFTVDPSGGWRLKGKAGLGALLGLLPRFSREDLGRDVRVVVSTALRYWCLQTGEPVPDPTPVVKPGEPAHIVSM
jgi:CHASE2 domain-containing sensor protein